MKKSPLLGQTNGFCSECLSATGLDDRQCPQCGHPTGVQRPANPRSRAIRRLLKGISRYSQILIAANVLIFAAMTFSRTGRLSSLLRAPTTEAALRFGAWFIPLMLQGQWWRLLSAIFVHFGPLHLLFNSVWLAQLAPPLEDVLGREPFLFLFLASGAGGFLLSVGVGIAFRGTGQADIGGGCSGSIFGLVTAGLILAYVRKLDGLLIFGKRILFWALLGLFLSFVPRVDMAAHLGGALTGSLLALVVDTRKERKQPSKHLWRVLEVLCLATLGATFLAASR